MAVSPLSSGIYGGLYADAELGQLFSDSAEIRAMLLFEGALATVQGNLAIIPADAAAVIHRGALDIVLDPKSLRDGTAEAGIPVPALVERFRRDLPDPAVRQWVHFGATTQDVMDTSLVLRLRRVLEIYDARLEALIATLADLAEVHRETVMAARTRHQVATPTTLGARIAAWGMPLIRHRKRLAELRPRLLVVSCAGASGTMAAMQGRGSEVMEGVAKALDLAPSPVPWHTSRDNIVELAGVAGMVAGGLGKMGIDLLAQMQTEVAELRAGPSGGSSTMPHKRNPVGPETLVQMARFAGPLVGALQGALIHGAERDATAWGQEWLGLPQLLSATGAMLGHAQTLAETLEVDTSAMRAPLAAHQGVMFAEAASFALSARMPRPDAQALVKRACTTALAQSRPLREILEAEVGDAADWDTVFDPLTQAGEAPSIADAFVALARS